MKNIKFSLYLICRNLGQCVVCLNIVQPGPLDLDSVSTWISHTEQNVRNDTHLQDDDWDDNYDPNNGVEAIHIAARDGDLDAVRQEIAENGVEVNFADHVDGSTALHWAARQVVDCFCGV